MATSVIEMKKADEATRLEIVRVIKASKQRVFDAWTRPEMIRRWFRPGTDSVADASMDAHEGGAWRLAMTGGCAEPDANGYHVVTGRYTKVDPWDVLQFTWKRAASPEEESLVTIELKDVAGGTEMKLTHERFLTEESRDRHANGWGSVLGRLQEFFAA